ncbi:hypothetical protein AAE02nite_25080 [Adhaeribacter aerolatus]|uniref:Uncharacterized protein n=1 Tax=Adhaeribacter aerolatus TaxID=670289 RepID=A0A512AYR0_9BACT|nr:hypothetical protein AAE02nite_25080 [Adhaeribacter aerolatus]
MAVMRKKYSLKTTANQNNIRILQLLPLAEIQRLRNNKFSDLALTLPGLIY